jgi:hypothetical protein
MIDSVALDGHKPSIRVNLSPGPRLWWGLRRSASVRAAARHCLE